MRFGSFVATTGLWDATANVVALAGLGAMVALDSLHDT
jgi:hypothetical protein